MDDALKPPLSAEKMQQVRIRCLKCEALLQARQTHIAVFNLIDLKAGLETSLLPLQVDIPLSPAIPEVVRISCAQCSR